MPKLLDFKTENTDLWKLGFDAIKELETDQGILASSQNEAYGAIFGRDSLITSLKLLRVYQQTKIADLPQVVRKVLLTLSDLQGKEVNVESGEEPGKTIHEYRPSKHEHLTKRKDKPWYVYPDGVMKNYDTVDATPLYLITAYRYQQISNDQGLINVILPKIKLSLEWLFTYGDKNKDNLIDYSVSPDRKSGGLLNHFWMDSKESTFYENQSKTVPYPIAPAEAQSYSYLALTLWSKYFENRDREYSLRLKERARELKTAFNQKFIINSNIPYVAAAIDGNGKQITSVRSNMGHVLWGATNLKDDGQVDGLVDAKIAHSIVERLMAPDMFEPTAGIRTLSSLSSQYKPHSYHNGSIWPHDNSMIAEGMEIYGFNEEATRVRQAFLQALRHFRSPVELYAYDHSYQDYLSPSGNSWFSFRMMFANFVYRSIKIMGMKTWSWSFCGGIYFIQDIIWEKTCFAFTHVKSIINGSQ